MDERVRVNRDHWDELAAIHQRPSRYYDVEAFRGGALSLRPVERRELGDVSGKSLLHLQCHFGLDTLSWARLGARVTGVDFSEPAIERARALAAECRISDARFVCADVMEAGDLGQFDVVFTSFGTTVWLPDLDRWAALVARSLVPGGTFYILDSHPFSHLLDTELRVVGSYFRDEPDRHGDGYGDYAVANAWITTPSYEWTHTLGSIVTSLVRAGLVLEHLHEYPFADWALLKSMVRGDDGYYRVRDATSPNVPLMYSIRARRP